MTRLRTPIRTPTPEGDITRNRITIGLAAFATAGLTTAGFLVAPQEAKAEAGPPGCPHGNVCILDNAGRFDRPADHRLAGNYDSEMYFWEGAQVFNNGVPQPGQDHVDITHGTPDRCAGAPRSAGRSSASRRTEPDPPFTAGPRQGGGVIGRSVRSSGRR